MEFQKKENITNIDFEQLFQFLDLHSQFSRKTLWSINKILQKQNKKIFTIPEKLKTKRLEELSRENVKDILK